MDEGMTVQWLLEEEPMVATGTALGLLSSRRKHPQLDWEGRIGGVHREADPEMGTACRIHRRRAPRVSLGKDGWRPEQRARLTVGVLPGSPSKQPVGRGAAVSSVSSRTGQCPPQHLDSRLEALLGPGGTGP